MGLQAIPGTHIAIFYLVDISKTAYSLRVLLAASTALLPFLTLSSSGLGISAFLVIFFGCLALDAVQKLSPNLLNNINAQNLSAELERLLLWIFALSYSVLFFAFLAKTSALPTATAAGLTLSWIALGGVPGLIVGHHLIHASAKSDRDMGWILFSVMGYAHFPMSHLSMHHRHLGTDSDAHACPRGLGFYQFLIRGWAGEMNFLSVMIRNEFKNKSAKTFVKTVGMSAAILITVAALSGTHGLAIYFTVALGTRTLIWVVNYVQHYGLDSNTEAQSWDLSNISTNLLFFNAGMHADHHGRAAVRASDLVMQSPYLMPFNFPIMMLLALVPAAFFASVHPLLDSRGAHEHA